MIRTFFSWVILLLGLGGIILSNFFKAPMVASTAAMQLEDSNVTYGLTKALVNSNWPISTLILVSSMGLFLYGIYRLSTGNKKK